MTINKLYNKIKQFKARSKVMTIPISTLFLNYNLVACDVNMQSLKVWLWIFHSLQMSLPLL